MFVRITFDNVQSFNNIENQFAIRMMSSAMLKSNRLWDDATVEVSKRRLFTPVLDNFLESC